MIIVIISRIIVIGEFLLSHSPTVSMSLLRVDASVRILYGRNS